MVSFRGGVVAVSIAATPSIVLGRDSQPWVLSAESIRFDNFVIRLSVIGFRPMIMALLVCGVHILLGGSPHSLLEHDGQVLRSALVDLAIDAPLPMPLVPAYLMDSQPCIGVSGLSGQPHRLVLKPDDNAIVVRVRLVEQPNQVCRCHRPCPR